MSDLVRETVAAVLSALIFNRAEDLRLLLNYADFKHLISNEPNLFQINKTLTGEIRYFLGVQVILLGTKSAPKVVEIVV